MAGAVGSRVGMAVVIASLLLAAAVPVGAGAPVRPADAGCGWATKLNEDTFNFFFPDTSATYWGAHLPFVPGSRLVIEGTYPEVRYFSFHAYDELQRPVASIADHAIDPDPGSVNPFRSPGASARPKDRSYTAYVEFTEEPEDPEPNTIYAGRTRDGAPNPAGFVIYRIYIPTDPDEPTGGVPLPTLTLEGPGGAGDLELGRCDPLPPDAGGQVNEAIRENNYPADNRAGNRHPAATEPPTFKPFYGTDQFPRDFNPENRDDDSAEARFQGGFLSNHQVAYLYAYLARGVADLIVLRIKTPTFPDTRAGDRVTAKRQVRYWSVCHNNGLSQRVVGCVADQEARPDRDGYVTIVISDPDDRPENATRADGVSWLPWGALYPEGLVIYRHMLPAKSFRQAIQNIPQGESASKVMGAYYPQGRYCARTDFESGGWAACTSD